MEPGKDFLGRLLEQAVANPCLRQNFDLHASPAGISQCMLNTLLPGTKAPIHRYEDTTETVICLVGRLEETIYGEVNEYIYKATSCRNDAIRQKKIKEISRQTLSPAEGKLGIRVSAGMWHTIDVVEPSVISEAKDGVYNESGNTTDRE